MAYAWNCADILCLQSHWHQKPLLLERLSERYLRRNAVLLLWYLITLQKQEHGERDHTKPPIPLKNSKQRMGLSVSLMLWYWLLWKEKKKFSLCNSSSYAVFEFRCVVRHYRIHSRVDACNFGNGMLSIPWSCAKTRSFCWSNPQIIIWALMSHLV